MGSVPVRRKELFAHPLAPATMAVLYERGFGGMTVGECCARAGITKADLPRRLRSRHLLALAVSEAYVGDWKARVRGAFEADGLVWPASLRAAAYETVRWIGEHPDAAWWGTVGVLDVGEVARARRDEVFTWAAGLIEAGREVAPCPEAVPGRAAMVAVGSIVETLGRSVQGTVADDLVAAVPHLMYSAVLLYLGGEAAARELEIPPPADLEGGLPVDLSAAFARRAS